MSDTPRGGEPEAGEHSRPANTPAEPETVEAAPAQPATATAMSAERKAMLGLAGAFALLVALAATAPFWASALPWGSAHDDADLRQRVDRLENAERQSAGVQQRLDKLDAAQRESQDARQRLAGIESTQQQLDKKLDQVAQQQSGGLTAAVQPLDRRIATLEAKPTVAPADLAALRQQADKQSAATIELAARVDTIDKTARARAADDTTDLALTLALLRIREAIDTGRPFAAEYDILAGVARNRPDIAPAVASLAAPAKTGVATRAVLIARLKSVGGDIAGAASQSSDGGWKGAVADKLSGLIQIRRVNDSGAVMATNASDATIDGAQRALAGSDLESAVASMAALSGSAAEQAAPWLGMARARLAVETALRRIEASLVARLGKGNPQPAASGSPG